jgi:hypothetical protein
LRQLASGTLSDPAALDLLRAFEARAAEGARAAKQEGQEAQAAAQALEASAETRAAGKAVAQAGDEAGDGERAAAALGASAAAHPAETARALASAAASLGGPAGETGDGTDAKEGQRRLSRNDSSEGTAPPKTAGDPSDPKARHLEQLRRELEDDAAACRAGDPRCRPRAEERGRELEQLGRHGAAQNSLQRLRRSAEQLRARVGRGELGQGDAQAMRSFGRAADGQEAAPGGAGDDETASSNEASEKDPAGTGAGRAGVASDGDGAGEGSNAAETAAASAAMAAAGGGASRDQDQAGNGDGIGHQPGGAPLGGRRNDRNGTAGSESEVRIADGAGPGRAEVIGTAAGRGFASPDYARAFKDYAAAVEDALGATAVPEGKRYLVRRYFDLIRPRPPARAARSPR